MKRLIFLSVLVLLSFAHIEAKNFKVDMDCARFKADSGKVFLEVYYSFPDTALKYKQKPDKSYIGELYSNIEILNTATNKTVFFTEWINENKSITAKKDTLSTLYGQKNFLLEPGNYTLKAKFKDVNDTTTKYIFSSPLVISSFSESKVAQSDLECTLEIKNATLGDEKKLFYKNNLIVPPNPSRLIASMEPTYYAYSEIYNAKKISPDGIVIEYKILNKDKAQVVSLERNVASEADAFVNNVELPLYDLPTDTYYFVQIVKYPKTNPTDSSMIEKKFFLANPLAPPDSSSSNPYTEDQVFQSSIFATLNTVQLQEELEKAKIVATEQEIDQYKMLSDNTAKQKALFLIWYKRDPDISTKINEKYNEVQELIAYANLNYSAPTSLYGWKSERGRVCVKYGKPTSIDKTQERGDTRGYEVWYYDTKGGGLQFYFVDMKGNGSFRLVHTVNCVSEQIDTNWYNRYVVKNNVNSNGTDSDDNYQKSKDRILK